MTNAICSLFVWTWHVLLLVSSIMLEETETFFQPQYQQDFKMFQGAKLQSLTPTL
jgi:hypothetical protein